jgi:hypothetical protein
MRFTKLGVIVLFSASISARAGLIQSISYDQAVGVIRIYTGAANSFLIGTNLPVSQSLSVSPLPGEYAGANYSFTDNGTTATLLINSQFAVLGQTNGVLGSGGTAQEGSQGQNFNLTFSQPVIYTETSSISAIGGSITIFTETTMGYSLNSSEVFSSGPVISGTNPSLDPAPISGLLSGNRSYNLWQTMGLEETSSGTEPPATGTGYFEITFTAVPEPACTSIIAIGGLGFLAWRKRKRPGRA